MAEKIRKLSNSEIEVLAKIVGECMTGTQMDSIFHECGVRDTSSESTKWKRIFYTFQAKQEIDGSSNAFLNFIKKSLNPVRFVSGKNGDHDCSPAVLCRWCGQNLCAERRSDLPDGHP